jgi:hypothetical protein
MGDLESALGQALKACMITECIRIHFALQALAP